MRGLILILAAMFLSQSVFDAEATTIYYDGEHHGWDCDPIEFPDGSTICISIELESVTYRGAEAIRFVRSSEGHRQLFAAADGTADVSRSDQIEALLIAARVFPDEARPMLVAQVESGSPHRIREAAMIGLVSIGDAEAARALIRIASDSSERRSIRKQALFWLGSMDSDEAIEFFDRLLLSET